MKNFITENLVELAHGYWRTVGGRAYIKQLDQEKECYKIFSANGNTKGYASSLYDATIKALEV